MAAFQKGDYPTAVARWEKLSPKLLDQEREMVSEYIAQARSRGGIAPASGPGAAVATQTPAPAASSPATTGGGISTVSVRVSLAPALSGRAAPGDTVFIFARAAEGPRMPLAIVRKTVADLPVEVTLDDSMAMSPTMRLSSFPSVVLGARISRSGNASAQTGDLEGLSAPLARAPGGSVQVVIDRENQGAALPGG
jgi:cytochrome c-type biogenesis protein CcmH